MMNVMLNVVMRSVVMLNVVILSVVKLSVAMLNVVAPSLDSLITLMQAVTKSCISTKEP
jgi:hypothetical protein